MFRVVAADIPSSTLQPDAKLPVVSHQAEKIGAVVETAGQEMPALAETRTPDVGAQAELGANQAKDQAVDYESLVANELGQPSLMPASFNSTKYVVKPVNDSHMAKVAQTSAGEAQSGTAAVTENGDQLQLPYALVLALIAIIGLVPVSRRNH